MTDTRILESGLDEPTVDIPRMEIFRAGDYGERGRFGEEDLDAIAGAYDPQKHEAPQTLDHAKAGPAYGWVKKVWREGASLFASLRSVPKTLATAIGNGRYGKRSAEIYRPGVVGDTRYLRAVSILGAQVPVVKGMAPIPASFAEATAFAEYEFPGVGEAKREEDQQASDKARSNPATIELPPAPASHSGNLDPEPKKAESFSANSNADKEEPRMSEKARDVKQESPKPAETDANSEKFAEKISGLEAKTKAQEVELEKLRKEAEAARAEARDTREKARFSEVMVKARGEGRIAAAEMPFFTAIFHALPHDEDAQVIEFGEGEEKKSGKPRELVLAHIATRPQLEIYREELNTADSIAEGQKGAKGPNSDEALFAEAKNIEKDLVKNYGYKPGEETFCEAVKQAAGKLGTSG